MGTYITKRRQSLSCSVRSFSDTPVMEKSSADKTHKVSLGGRSDLSSLRVALPLLGSSYVKLYNACK